MDRITLYNMVMQEGDNRGNLFLASVKKVCHEVDQLWKKPEVKVKQSFLSPEKKCQEKIS